MSDAPQARRRSSVWLIVSLCVNFFLTGLVVAGLVVTRARMIAGAVRGEGDLPPEVIVQLLPPSGAAKMCEVVDANVAAFAKLGRDLLDARREVFKTFRADPFDAAAFKIALDHATAAQVALAHLRQDVALQVTEKLDDKERGDLSRKLIRRFFNGGRGERVDHPTLRDLCAATRAGTASQPPH